ncbi:MAG TPA: histidinol-phosphate transaminase [Bacteroidia bacterium]
MKHQVVRLFANENIYGCSPKVLSVMKKNLSKVNFYPNFNPVLLERKIAELFNVSPLNIVIGAGSVRILDGIIQTFVGHDEEVLTFEKSFVAYSQLAETYKRTCRFANQANFQCEVRNIIALITDRTKIIFIANPNNPTGTMISHNDLKFLMENISKKVIVVVDEAYMEYVTEKKFPDSIGLLNMFPNLVIVRTFSKAYGLAGLRVGYAIADKAVIVELKKSRIPFSINYLAEEAAMAALSDKSFIRRCAKANEKERKFLYDQLVRLKFNTMQSQANFIYVYFDDEMEKEKVYECISASGILICNMKIFGQERSLRIGVGDRTANKKIIALLASYRKNSVQIRAGHSSPSSAKLK